MKIALVMSLYNEFYLIENTLDSILGDTKYECDVFINLSGSRFFEKNIEYLNKINNKNYRLFMDATKLDNVVLTPHIGAYAKEIRIKMEVEAAENLIKGLNEE